MSNRRTVCSNKNETRIGITIVLRFVCFILLQHLESNIAEWVALEISDKAISFHCKNCNKMIFVKMMHSGHLKSPPFLNSICYCLHWQTRTEQCYE